MTPFEDHSDGPELDRVFDFPDRSTGEAADAVPELIVDYVRGERR